MKGVLIEINFGKMDSSSLEPAIKFRLESSLKQSKEYKLESLIERLERAASIRETMLQLRGERLRSLSQVREIKVKRKVSYEEVEKQELFAKLVADHEEAEKRRLLRQNEIVRKLQEKNEKTLKTAAEVNQRKKEEINSLKDRIMGKLEDYEVQRIKSQEERVKRLESYHTKLAKAVELAKIKIKKRITDIASCSERKQLHARENRMKHISEIKILAEETADKVKKIQEFIFNSECM